MDRFPQPSSERKPLRKPQEDELADYKEQEAERMIEQVEHRERHERTRKLRDPIGD